MVNSKGLIIEDVKVYTEIGGKKQLMTFRCQKPLQCFSSSKKQTTKDLLAFNKLKNTAKKLQNR
jgi:hypothetical protein